MSDKRLKTIRGLRIWPAPRWPLIHEAKRILANGGLEGLQLWAATLSPGDYAALVDQLTDLMRAGIKRVEKEVREECPDPVVCPGCGELKIEERVYCTKCGTWLPRE